MRKFSLLSWVLWWTAVFTTTVLGEEPDSDHPPSNYCPICFGYVIPSNTTASFRLSGAPKDQPTDQWHGCDEPYIRNLDGTPIVGNTTVGRRGCYNEQQRAYPACGCPFRPKLEECHHECATCRGRGPTDCLTCKDGSSVTSVNQKHGLAYGFCGPVCPICFGGATPSNPDGVYRWEYDFGNDDDDYGMTSTMTMTTTTTTTMMPMLMPMPMETNDNDDYRNDDDYDYRNDDDENDYRYDYIRFGCDQENITTYDYFWDDDYYGGSRLYNISVKAGSETCLSEQVNTYRFCGCPELPPLETEADYPLCTLCADGSKPKNPDALVTLPKDLSSPRAQEVTCARLDDSFAHDAWQNWGNEYAELDSMECTNSQHQYYEECGCPKPEPSPDACLLCSDGALIPHNHSTVALRFGESLWYGRGLSNNFTCGELQDLLPFLGIARDSQRCTNLQYEYHSACGCTKPEPHPDSCTLCSDGAPVPQNHSEVKLAPDFFTCGELQEYLQFSYLYFEECSIWQRAFYTECGCSKPKVNPDACDLCSSSAPLPQIYSGVTVPTKELRELGYHYYDDFPKTHTCGFLQEMLLFDDYTFTDSWYCERYQKVGDTYCGCANAPMLAPTQASIPQLPPYVSIDSPKPFDSSSNGYRFVGVMWHIGRTLAVTMSLLLLQSQ